ncbi:hypothetical protein CXB51_004898 [Gossypium anomalum]|uniref:DUF7745 domain-containing protein n=1 Tax=Gossypium anomalum TaxID=47600 RepID=A0A8J5ZCX9_9ROSI|nr:hypothetical protein CXB51_004898 [Gossypium anomalum]
MKKGFLDRVEDNAAVRVWSEKMQQEKCDSLTKGYESKLWDFTRINNPAYSYFTFGGVDLVRTVEEYMALLNCPKIQADRAYSRSVNVPSFLKKLMNITGMSEQWVAARINQKCDSKCIPWRNLRDFILAHSDSKKRVDVFALSLFGLIIFPKALGYIDEVVSNLFDRLDKGTTPVPAILAETFRSLNEWWRTGEGRFIGYAQPLLAWFHSHFWKVEKVSYRVFSKDYSPLRELVATSSWNTGSRRIRSTTGVNTVSIKKVYTGNTRVGSMRVNDNIPLPNQGNTQSIEEHLRIIPSELDIIKQDFEKRNSELGKKIEQLEEEKMKLGLDVDIRKLEAEKLRK